MMTHINDQRARHGLKPVRLNEKLTSAAQAHAADMAAGDFFAHKGSDGSQATDRLARAGYIFRLAAENIAAGTKSAKDTVDRWMKSEGHRHNILLPDVRDVGVGYVFLLPDEGEVRYRHYWTLTLGASQ